MTVAVAGRGEILARMAARRAQIVRGEKAVRADDLAVACERRSGIGSAREGARARAGRYDVGLPLRIRVGERRMLGPDAAVEHADDHAFAGLVVTAELSPDRF